MVVCLGLYRINQTMVDAVQYYEYNKQYTTKKGVTVDYNGSLVALNCVSGVIKPPSSKLDEQNGGNLLDEQIGDVILDES